MLDVRTVGIGLVCLLTVTPAILFGQSLEDTGRPSAVAQPTAATRVTQVRQEWRLPVSVRHDPAGLKVVALHEAVPQLRLTAPGTRGSLAVGDIISHVSGQPIRTLDDLFQHYAQGPAPLPLQVINVRDGISREWTASCEQVETSIGPPLARANGEGQVIFIHAVDTLAPRIGINLEKNIQPMRELFDAQLLPQYLKQYTILKDSQCNAISIIKQLAAADVGPQDTLILFYQGHGAYDPNFAARDPAAGQFFDFTREDLWRRDLLRAMQSKGARLTILMSDSCNVKSTMDLVPRTLMELRVVEITGWTALEQLLLCYRGTLDLNSVSRGQLAWSTKDLGGWFTNAWITTLQASPRETSWALLWDRAKDRTQEIFSKRRAMYGQSNAQLRRQSTMVPQEFTWSLQRDEPPNPPTVTRQLTIAATAERP